MPEDTSSVTAIESLLGDRYTREARLAPAFLSFLPVLVLLLGWFGDLKELIPGLLAFLCFFGIVRWISHIARNIGDRKEIELFCEWGGKPTTTMLRCKPNRSPVYLQARPFLLQESQRQIIATKYHQRQHQLLPTEAEEEEMAANDSEALDRLYEPVVAWLRETTRKHSAQNSLVFEENISYGFQRNFHALKPFALLCGVGALVIHCAAITVLSEPFAKGIVHFSWATAIAVPIAIIAYLTGLVYFVSKRTVMIQGFAYARQLIFAVAYANEKA